jgi:hypothetical protein
MLLVAAGELTDQCVATQPLTGRTHQIRLHLQWLGHPIANDPNYGAMPSSVFASTADYDAVSRHSAVPSPHEAPTGDAGEGGEEEGGTDEDLLYIPEGCVAHEDKPSLPAEYTGGLSGAEVDNLKGHCKYCLGLGHRGLFTDVQLRHTGIFLHALQYEVSLQLV